MKIGSSLAGLVAAVAVLVGCGGGEAATEDPGALACQGQGREALGEPHDSFMLSHANQMSTFWAVPMNEFYFVNDRPPAQENAYACANGNIAFGSALYARHLQDHGELGVVSILSHEFAHLVQHATGPFLEPPMHELEADALAAYHLRMAFDLTLDHVNVTYTHVGSLGESTPASHGTSQQRLDATYLGFRLADEDRQTGQRRTTQQLREIIATALSGSGGTS